MSNLAHDRAHAIDSSSDYVSYIKKGQFIRYSVDDTKSLDIYHSVCMCVSAARTHGGRLMNIPKK